jgi:ADP-ribose pyrophosphatase YjhB (NUDIX family)
MVVLFDMAFVGPYNYALVVLRVGSPNASDMKIVLQREPKSDKAWFLVGTVLPDEEHVDAAVYKFFEETGMIMTDGDLTLMSGKVVRVPLPESKTQHVRCFSTCALRDE